MMKRLLRRTALTGVTAAATASMAFGVARPIAEGRPSCPPIDIEGMAYSDPDSTAATRLVDQLGASVVSVIGFQCERRSVDENITAKSLGHGAVRLTLTRPIAANSEGKPGGSYVLSATTLKNPEDQLSPAGITEFRIAENVRDSSGAETPLFDIDATFDSINGWQIVTKKAGYTTYTFTQNTQDSQNANQDAQRAYHLMSAEQIAAPIPADVIASGSAYDG